MCCFSVTSPNGALGWLFAWRVRVSATNIFARMIAPGVQALAYGMNLSTTREVAMILPLPVAPGTGEDAVKFVSLEKHPRMFIELARLFGYDEPLRRKDVVMMGASRSRPLVVHTIGSFIASYVPSRADFARLDPRFRVPEVLFDAMPHYADYGFAVFQLAPGKVTVHPMALTFPTRDPERLFFPTVHVHDGRFRRTAKFDHALYYQHPRCGVSPELIPVDARAPFDESPRATFEGGTIGDGAPHRSYEGLAIEEWPVLRRTLKGRLPNADTWIAAT